MRGCSLKPVCFFHSHVMPVIVRPTLELGDDSYKNAFLRYWRMVPGITHNETLKDFTEALSH